MTAYPALAARIRQEIGDMQRSADRTVALMAKSVERGDVDYLDGVALNLHGFYTGLEHVLQAIEREVDRAVPSGPEWHRDLLLQMAGGLGDVRPAVLADETRRCLDVYRGFRHVVGNVYTHNLDVRRLRGLVEDLPSCCAAAAADLTRFARFLDALR